MFLSSFAFAQFDGFTEPYRTIELASDETGLIDRVFVNEGDSVAAGGEIAKLSSDLQQVQLELAQHLATANSSAQAAEKTYEKRRQVYEQVLALRQQNYANENELTRAAMELDLAKAKWQAARDETVTREIELRRAAKQLEKRTVIAPFAGVIAKVHRKEGEYLSPLRPEIVTLVRIDQLYATFNVPTAFASTLKTGTKYALEVGDVRAVPATLDFVGVQTDAESGTVRVKLLIDNPAQRFRPGEPCIWNM